MALPLISVVLPVYNGEKFLHQAIESCLAQTYSNFELLIVNDASSDRSLEIAREFQKRDKRIKIINNKKNIKLPGSLNKGHKAAQGVCFTWISDDNILKPDFLQILLEEITLKKFDVVFSDFDIIWKDGELKRVHTAGPVEGLIFGDTVGASFLYRREVFENLKGYNENLFLVEDYDFFLRASLSFKIGYVNKNLIQYRLHEKSLSSKINNDKIFTKDHERALFLMFNTATSALSFRKKTVEFLIKLYFKHPIDLGWYFHNELVLKEDILKFQNSLRNGPEENVIDILQEKFFWNLYRQDFKVSFLELLKILKSERKIFFNRKISKNALIRFCYEVCRQNIGKWQVLKKNV